jgi:hypothetical protein
VHAELTLGLDLPVNPKRIAGLMRAAGIQGLYAGRLGTNAAGLAAASW